MKSYSNADVIGCFVSPDQNSKHSKVYLTSVLLQSPLVDKRGYKYKYVHIFPAQKISLCNQMNSAIL